MLKDLISRTRAFLIGSVVLAVAAAIALVSAAYGIYAVLRLILSAPASAGITAVIFAAVALASALTLRGAVKKPAAPTRDPRRSGHGSAPAPAQIGFEAATAVVGVLGELLASRRNSARGKDAGRRSGRR